MRPTLVVAGLAAVAIAIVLGVAWQQRLVPGPAASTTSVSLLPKGTNVLLVTVDTLRPDALGFAGSSNSTPNIDKLARDGVRFVDAVTAVPLTLPSHTTLMSGLYPTRHDVHDNGQTVPSQVPLLAERFRNEGYATGAFISAFVLRHEFGLDRGFDIYDDDLDPDNSGRIERRADQTIAAAKRWLANRKGNWFLWVHLYDPHAPYQPPSGYSGQGARAAYDGEVAYVDSNLGPLFEAAQAAGKGQLLTVLTSDHAESLGEHGEIQHGVFVYDSTMLVPLIITSPGLIAPSAPLLNPRLVDVAPTILDALGWPPELSVDGVSLVPSLRGEVQSIPAAYLESQFPWITYSWAPLHALRSPDRKFIDAPHPELYDLKADAAESINLFSSTGVIAPMVAELDRIRLAKPVAKATVGQDAEAIAKLQSLGYLGAGAAPDDAPAGRPDPKDLIALQPKLQLGEDLFVRGEWASAVQQFQAILETDPTNRFAVLRMGLATLRMGNIPDAIKYLRDAVRQSPRQAEAHYALADALARGGHYAEATQHWLETVGLQPGRVAAWSNLGSTLAWQKQFDKAVDAFQQAADLKPGDPQLLGNLGEAEYAAGRTVRAISHLQEAAELESVSTRRASRIGTLLLAHGDEGKAREWLERATPADPGYATGQVELAELWSAQSLREPAVAALRRACRADPAMRGVAASRPHLSMMLDACDSNAD